LESEIAALKPEIIVCLGATASQALFGAKFRLTEHRGELLQSHLAKYVTATVHPSSILRARDDETRRAEMEAFVDDLKRISDLQKRD
jgi:DNA polymerase